MTLVYCPACNKKLKVADDLLGKNLRCRCGRIFAAPAAKQAKAAEAEPIESPTPATTRPPTPSKGISTSQILARTWLFVMSVILCAAVIGWQQSRLAVSRGPREWPPVLFWVAGATAVLGFCVAMVVRWRGWIWKPALVLFLLVHSLGLFLAWSIFSPRVAGLAPVPSALVITAMAGGLIGAWLIGLIILWRVGPRNESSSASWMMGLATGCALAFSVAMLDLMGAGSVVWGARAKFDEDACRVRMELVRQAEDRYRHQVRTSGKLAPTLAELDEECDVHCAVCSRYDRETRREYLPEYLRKKGIAFLTAKYGSMEKTPEHIRKRLDQHLTYAHNFVRYKTRPACFDEPHFAKPYYEDRLPVPLVWDNEPHGEGVHARHTTYFHDMFTIGWMSPEEKDTILSELMESLTKTLDMW